MREKPVVGQEVVFCNLDHEKHPVSCRMVTITEVGRKYFKINYSPVCFSDLRFRLKDWYEDTNGYPANYRIYCDREEIQSEIAANLALKTLRQYFISMYVQVPVSADELLECCSILGLYEGVRAELDERLDKLNQESGES